mmetsp:Transcript_23023/g.50385  ORF Transcript_23023/g.50385 Transcript_23023/m.50385 type:complete len:484 (-) Transcript_23023:736-2187(-)
MSFKHGILGDHHPLPLLGSTELVQMSAAGIREALSELPLPYSRARRLASRREKYRNFNSTHQPGIPSAFAALGGSNTVGASRAGMAHSFAELLFEELRASELVDRFVMGGIGGMGPLFNASCAQKYVPEDTRFATIEFLPNIGWSNIDEAELSAIEILLQVLHSRGAKTVLVAILPGSGFRFYRKCVHPAVQGCQTHEHMLRLYHRLLSFSDTFSVPIVAMDYEDPLHTPYFSGDLLHLNQKGHQLMQQRVLKSFKTWTSWPHPATKRAASRESVACSLGSEIALRVGKNDGFRMVNFAVARNEIKIGWEARAPAAELFLCSDLPSFADDSENNRSAGPQHAARYPYSIIVGMQRSPSYNRPLYGVATITCHGACVCMCTSRVPGACLFDGLVPFGPEIIEFVRLRARDATPLHPHSKSTGCGLKQCAVRVAVNNTIGRSRVLVRSFTVGHFAPHNVQWLDFYFRTNNESRPSESKERRGRVH